jgi:hypothetical protein
VSLLVDQGGKKVPLKALADTGCDCGISLTKEQMEDLELDFGKKQNDYPLPIGIADGSTVGADRYKCVVEVGGERRLVEVWVVDPSNKLDIKDEDEDSEDNQDEPVLLGRDFMNHYDAHFSGFEKKITFLK